MNALETTISALRKMTAGQLAAWAQTHGIDLSSLLLAECEAYAEAQLSNSEAPPAAAPWIKIEPGCVMPEDDVIVLICINGLIALGCYNAKLGWWSRGQLVTPTYYAVVRMPECED